MSEPNDITSATLPLCTSENSCRSISRGPSHKPRSAMNEAYPTLDSSMIPSVCGSKNSAPNLANASRNDSLGKALTGCSASRAGSCTSRQISSHASAAITPSAAKPMRQEVASISQASGVPVISMPIPPRPRMMPEIAAKRPAGKCREINTVHTRNAGAHPMPIRTWPNTSM